MNDAGNRLKVIAGSGHRRRDFRTAHSRDHHWGTYPRFPQLHRSALPVRERNQDLGGAEPILGGRGSFSLAHRRGGIPCGHTRRHLLVGGAKDGRHPHPWHHSRSDPCIRATLERLRRTDDTHGQDSSLGFRILHGGHDWLSGTGAPRDLGGLDLGLFGTLLRIKCDEWNLSLCVINLGAYLEKNTLLLYEDSQ